jgi:release factor glutamine methyltransferase
VDRSTLPVARVARDLLRACPLPAAESRALLCEALGVAREYLVAHPEAPVTGTERERFEKAAAHRLGGMPLAYVLGHQEFYGHRFTVNPAVLVPRPDTELLVDTAISLLADRTGARVLELGTGSGCIAITLGLARPDLCIVATDRSIAALDIARGNQVALGSNVQFLAADWFAPLLGTWDLVVANPPYIAEGDVHLDALAFEPRHALTSGPDGLRDLRHIAGQAPARLASDGYLLVEHGYDQATAVRQLLEDAGLHDVRTLHDLAGRERACLGRAAAGGEKPCVAGEGALPGFGRHRK